ncbi:PRA1 family protein D-like [Camellia sinensis]|uniref:PRA1 family protein n=1 Tax=Camellia sinensis var. sinensis TaxID=542762 RepID=A0A4S4ECC5_CAMSN|nr:PRA1 family protein D-like [Camellia sinensis]THG13275.1 hypothetical protein TEA_000148 [Camellia sinensis var. sinensis]
MATTTTVPGRYTPIQPSTFPPPPFSSATDFSSQIHHSISSTLRPWSQLFSLSSLSLPLSFSEASFRIRTNLFHFRLNYTIISLIILLITLIYHPISIIVFLFTIAAWFYLYIFRHDTLVLFNRTIDDRLVLILLSLATLVALIFTNVWLNVLVSMLISTAVVCLHAAIRFPDDVDDQESPYGPLLSVVDSPRGYYSQV